MTQTVKPAMPCLFMALIALVSLKLTAQTTTGTFIVNDLAVPINTILQLEKKYGVKCTPGDYWYDKISGAFGIKNGPCTGIGIANLEIGGIMKANASAGTTGVFINGRELHVTDVQGLQTFMLVVPGRYWVDAYGNFGMENSPFLGNLYQLYKSKAAVSKKSTYPKFNPWSGESTRVGTDGSFIYFSTKKADGRTIDYMND